MYICNILCIQSCWIPACIKIGCLYKFGIFCSKKRFCWRLFLKGRYWKKVCLPTEIYYTHAHSVKKLVCGKKHVAILKYVVPVKWPCNYSSSLMDWWRSWFCSIHTVYIKSFEACCELASSAFSYNSSVKVTIKWIIYPVSPQKCHRRTQESGHDTISKHFHSRPSSHCCVCVWWDTYWQRRRSIFWRPLPEHPCRLCSSWVHTHTHTHTHTHSDIRRAVFLWGQISRCLDEPAIKKSIFIFTPLCVWQNKIVVFVQCNPVTAGTPAVIAVAALVLVLVKIKVKFSQKNLYIH